MDKDSMMESQVLGVSLDCPVYPSCQAYAIQMGCASNKETTYPSGQ